MKAKKVIKHIYQTNTGEFDCDTTQNHLPAYVDSKAERLSFSQDIAQQVEHHLFHCPDCAELYEGMLYLATTLSQNDEPVETANLAMPTYD